jgi:hypothetical protein
MLKKLVQQQTREKLAFSLKYKALADMVRDQMKSRDSNKKSIGVQTDIIGETFGINQPSGIKAHSNSPSFLGNSASRIGLMRHLDHRPHDTSKSENSPRFSSINKSNRKVAKNA